MGEPSGGPPTFYANFVTSMINVDELTMEFRRVLVSHKDVWRSDGAPVVVVPPVTPGQIAEVAPVARVILTFSAAQALKAWLDEVLPKIEASRRTGEPFK